MAAPRPFSKAGGWGRHVAATYRSGLEDKVAKQLETSGVPFDYEAYTVGYSIPASLHKYHPDFVLPNGIIVETKGIFDADDRKKHTLIRQQHPHLDVRFVFSSSKSKLYKGSPTTYAAWCEKNGFQYADKLIPPSWLKEPKGDTTGLTRKKEKQP
ncbi:endonuclease [Ralstonia phage RPSC1]|uniref:Endonuclease-like protein n=1 Tax=Ralstonia phage RPSC1 TaxID=2041351 RepID=A0A2Z2U7X4_9CAUD|nr:endonuclease [Ralstonia phage RPSC1]ATN92959.1 endonuclease-like protein [Ralstonia phage RPSC1]